MASDTSLVFNILARDRASKVFGKIEGALGKLSTAIVGLGVGAAAGLAKVGGDFDSAFDRIAVATGATGEALEGLEQDFREILARVPNDMATVADSLGQLQTLTGATGDTLQDMVVQVTEASRLLGEDASANSAAFGETLRQWQVPAEDAAGVMDMLFLATQKYNVGLGDIMTSLTSYGGTLMNVGFSMEETVDLFSQLDAAGLDISRTMPALNRAFGNWAKEGKNVQSEFDKVIGTIATTKNETEALGIATEVFGSRGAATLVSAIRSGAVEFGNLGDALADSEGLISQTAEQTDDWREKLQKLKNEALVAIEPAASAVFDKLSDGVDILRSVMEWAKRNTGTVKVLAGVLGGLAGTIVAVNGAMRAYRLIQMTITNATKLWTAAQAAFNLVMSLNPIGLVIVAIAGLIAAVVAIEAKTKFFSQLWSTVWGAIKDAAAAVGRWFVDTLWGKWIKGAFDAVKSGVTGVRDWFTTTWDKIVEFFRGIPDKISRVARGMWDGITQSFKAAVNFIIDAWNRLDFSIGPYSIPSWVPHFGGRSFHIPDVFPDIPRLAEGGIVTRPTLALTGERGPEAVIPLNRAGGAAMQTTVVLRVDGSRASRLLAELFREALRTNPGFRAEVHAA